MEFLYMMFWAGMIIGILSGKERDTGYANFLVFGATALLIIGVALGIK